MSEPGLASRAAAEPGIVHATCLVWGETGILLRGPSGVGKSSLARELIEAGRAEGRFARLVADDRVRLAEAGGRLLAVPVPPLEGLLEVRGIGLVAVDHEPACVVGLLVDLVPVAPTRLPDTSNLKEVVTMVTLPRLACERADALSLVLWRLRGARDTHVTDR